MVVQANRSCLHIVTYIQILDVNTNLVKNTIVLLFPTNQSLGLIATPKVTNDWLRMSAVTTKRDLNPKKWFHFQRTTIAEI